jgi:hypothetical protein
VEEVKRERRSTRGQVAVEEKVADI